MGQRGIGVGIGLEIGDIGTMAGHFPLHLQLGSFNLLMDRIHHRCGKVPGASCAAEDTWAAAKGPVTARAGHAAV